MKLILLGAPGSGKGTQAEKISASFGIPHVSTGEIIRDAMKSGSELGNRAKKIVEEGRLLPDETVIEMVRERLSSEACADGFILDGFPRTIPQAEALDKLSVTIDLVLDIEVDDQRIINRLSGRRTCGECGAVYNVESKPPQVDGICDKCGGTLIQRKDDTKETIENRLDIYHKETKPLVGYYEGKGLLRTVIGQEELSDTTELVNAVLESYK